MNLILSVLLNSIAVFVTASILPGVHLSSFFIAIIVAAVLGLINTFVRPVLLVLTLPINILTLGLLTFAVMGLCVWLATAIVPGFTVDSFWWAVGFASVMALIGGFIRTLAE